MIRDQHCGWPSDVYDTDGRTKLTALETISRWLLLKKTKKSLFELPFRALRGNVRTPSMARWKARGRLYICRNWTFFAISYGWDVMSRNRSKSAFFEGRWATLSADFRGKGASPTKHCWYESSTAEWLPFRVLGLSKYLQCTILICHNPLVWQTDGRTDGHTDRITTPKTALAYARAVKTKCRPHISIYGWDITISAF